MVNWGGILVERKALSGVTYGVLEKYRGSSDNKDNEIWWLLLSTVDAMQKDNEKQRVINRQLKAKCRGLLASFTAHEEALILCVGGRESLRSAPGLNNKGS